MPINEVAKDLGVCATVLKKICRRNGIPRWPHRKIKSLDKMIKTLETTVAKKPEDEERIKQEIATLRNKKMFLMKNPNVLSMRLMSSCLFVCLFFLLYFLKVENSMCMSNLLFIVKGSKSGSKFKGTTTKSVASTSTSSSTTTPANVPEKTEWNPPSTLSSYDFTSGALQQQEEAAKSLLNVFASLQNKLQDQPKESSAISTDCSAWHLNAMEPQAATSTSPSMAEQKALFSLELPKLVLSEANSSLWKEKKLMTMEPTVAVGNSATTLFVPAPLFPLGAASPRQDSVSLPNWFVQEKEQYEPTTQHVFSSPLSLNALCNPSPRNNVPATTTNTNNSLSTIMSSQHRIL